MSCESETKIRNQISGLEASQFKRKNIVRATRLSSMCLAMNKQYTSGFEGTFEKQE
jgi:hypothetical protein